MSEFNVLAALVAGFIATVVMTAMMTMASKAGMTRTPPMPLVMGAMMSGDRRKAMAIGSMLHFVVLGTIVFGIGYALVFQAFGSTDWWLGILIGLVHGMAVGLVFMPMMPSIIPGSLEPGHRSTTGPCTRSPARCGFSALVCSASSGAG